MPEGAKSGGWNVKILLPERSPQGLAASGEQREGATGRLGGPKAATGCPGPFLPLLRNMYKKRLAFLYTIVYYHTNAIKKTPRRSGFAAIPIRELLRIHTITVRKRPCGCVRSVFVFRGGESQRVHNGNPEGPQRNPGGI